MAQQESYPTIPYLDGIDIPAGPEVSLAQYDVEVGFGQVWRQGGETINDLRFDPRLDPTRYASIFRAILPTTLAWVDCYTSARVEIRHDDGLLAHHDSKGLPAVETIRGIPYRIGPRQFLAVRDEVQPIFMTAAEIQDSGSMPDDMKEWVEAVYRRHGNTRRVNDGVDLADYL